MAEPVPAKTGFYMSVRNRLKAVFRLLPAQQRLRVAVSFVVDVRPDFAVAGDVLVRSIRGHAEGLDLSIHMQAVEGVSEEVKAHFRTLGCVVHEIARFGDGAYCNKIRQLGQLRGQRFDYALLLDTDTIVTAPLAPLFSGDCVAARCVGGPKPSLNTLRELAHRAGMVTLPPCVEVDCRLGETYLGNCNGGVILVPGHWIEKLSIAWEQWTGWVLQNLEPMIEDRTARNADQVGLWLAMHMNDIPYAPLAGNFNHNPLNPIHRSSDYDQPIAILHYHRQSIMDGLTAHADAPSAVGNAVREANRIVGLL